MKKLLQIMQALRDPETGCPWDVKQTFESVVPYTLEEAYEVADAIEQGDMQELKSELGDLLFQVVFYAQMAQEKGEFDFNDVVDAVSEKLVSRHPHVFENKPGGKLSDDKLSDDKLSDEQLHEAWEKTKATERDDQTSLQKASILDGVAKALPALKRAQKLQKRAARNGFDWPSIEPVFEKIYEEIQELREAIEHKETKDVFEEMGDLLFSCVNLARHLDVDSEESLRACNKKFEQRFSYIEDKVNKSERKMLDVSLEELEEMWQAAKKQ